MENLLGWSRTKHGNSLIPKGGSGKRIIRLLRENHAIGILSDQNVDKREGVFVDFFGRPACTSVGTAVLALQSGAPVLPAFMPRMPDGRYRLIILRSPGPTTTSPISWSTRSASRRWSKTWSADIPTSGSGSTRDGRRSRGSDAAHQVVICR